MDARPACEICACAAVIFFASELFSFHQVSIKLHNAETKCADHLRPIICKEDLEVSSQVAKLLFSTGAGGLLVFAVGSVCDGVTPSC